MKCPALVLGAGLLAFAAQANPAWQGRWEGEAAVPGLPLPLILDLAPGHNGGWTGSITLPGRAVKGAALRGVAVDATGIRAALPASFGDAADSGLDLKPQPDGSLAGTLRQGGHEAALTLVRSGAAQVDAAPVSTPLSPALEGTWIGGYELGGYPREMTLTLSQRAGVGVASLLIVGKQRSAVPIDLVIESGRLLRLVSDAAGLSLEAWLPVADNRLRGQLLQGPFEADFVLRRAPR